MPAAQRRHLLGLRLDDPGFHFSVLTEFRARLLVGHAEYLLLDRMLVHFKARGLIRPRGRQRTDSTHVLGAVRDLHLLVPVTDPPWLVHQRQTAAAAHRSIRRSPQRQLPALQVDCHC